ncbi:ATP-binding cassette domain-containing protein [Maritimibacter fusiformis]|uniref:ATP-binding cassette domain-containing protein n=1 Tax=Maritimibacter fusiformis TaxID=2603819 RepID=A0A5D0R8M6_9RHOB|nr:ATP-binding cassette domain-containing protein [Maritimibacter fusiformis]TYB77793.1 ATP-binding cassette domain-containing protein [Maritimibacter fusiformis]
MLTLEKMLVALEDWTLSADFTVPTGAKVAVLGPSGAGKSTLLAAIAGFLPVASGRVMWNAAELTAAPPAARPVSMIFQDNNLFPHLTAAQNVGLGLRPDLRLDADQHKAVDKALARVGLAGFGPRKPGRLSGGQAARVALARALLRNQPLMLLDEPFGALGPALRTEMLDLVADLADETGATLMMVSHEPDDAKSIADLVILVAEGIAYPPVPTAEIFANPPKALSDYLG